MKELPAWVKKWKTRGIEIQKRGKNYYAYRITSKWNPEKKRAQKVTIEYLGVVTPKGIIKVRSAPKRYTVLEYVTIELIRKVSQDLEKLLRKHFPGEWKEDFASLYSFIQYEFKSFAE